MDQDDIIQDGPMGKLAADFDNDNFQPFDQSLSQENCSHPEIISIDDQIKSVNALDIVDPRYKISNCGLQFMLVFLFCC